MKEFSQTQRESVPTQLPELKYVPVEQEMHWSFLNPYPVLQLVQSEAEVHFAHESGHSFNDLVNFAGKESFLLTQYASDSK